MTLPASFLSARVTRIAACTALLGLVAVPAQAQSALSDKEGHETLLSCAAFFSAAAVIAGDDKKMAKDATDLATAFMTGAVLLAPGGNTSKAEAALEEQAELFAVAMLDESSSMAKDLEGLADSCGTLGENYLPEVLARAQ